MAHGLFALGRLPKGASFIRRQVGRLRAQLEASVREQSGSVALYQNGLISSATRHELRALLLTRWLREATALPMAERLALVRALGEATDARDRAIRGLGLADAPAFDPITALLYSNQPNQGGHGPQAATESHAASGGDPWPSLEVFPQAAAGPAARQVRPPTADDPAADLEGDRAPEAMPGAFLEDLEGK
jgi:hypothetical protein